MSTRGRVAGCCSLCNASKILLLADFPSCAVVVAQSLRPVQANRVKKPGFRMRRAEEVINAFQCNADSMSESVDGGRLEPGRQQTVTLCVSAGILGPGARCAAQSGAESSLWAGADPRLGRLKRAGGGDGSRILVLLFGDIRPAASRILQCLPCCHKRESGKQTRRSRLNQRLAGRQVVGNVHNG